MLTIFTHIPKTAGTSFFRRVFHPNVEPNEILSQTSLLSFRRSLRPDHRVVTGHRAFGLHRLTRRPCRYVTMLRQPVDRAISAYHFILQCDPALCEHTLYDIARRNSISDFYSMPRFQNEMTQMLAGMEYELMRRYIGQPWFEKRMLDRAKYNLEHRYIAFGIKEEFATSAAHVSRALGFPADPPADETGRRHKQTRARPTINGLSEQTRRTLIESHQLDMELYEFACELFQRRIQTQQTVAPSPTRSAPTSTSNA
ncbi:hypothetical protein CRI94_12510 [Longibacter salinarum]|uniref:Sulfotransferase family protein n=1 Tax=Longibacter salinarum TaxID=1850348 RepID=A0A2A8CW35_9BACT|nr:sulfotransferase family 2 domain-containing protein [Longibacter salinarum]PEN12821.1 hypothetical protein CRI94_12510 [Longibacter salinarum]